MTKTSDEEKAEIIKLLENEFNIKIINTWVPAEGYEILICLFVRVREKDSEDYKIPFDLAKFELTLLEKAKPMLEQCKYFNCVALF